LGEQLLNPLEHRGELRRVRSPEKLVPRIGDRRQRLRPLGNERVGELRNQRPMAEVAKVADRPRIARMTRMNWGWPRAPETPAIQIFQKDILNMAVVEWVVPARPALKSEDEVEIGCLVCVVCVPAKRA
jgi:hypothetical protein